MAAANDSESWHYLDSTGQEFGPFPGETMREWFTQGYFPIGEELLVRLPSWKNHVPLKMVYPDVNNAFNGPPAVNARGGAPGPRPPDPMSYAGGPMGGGRGRPEDVLPPFAGGQQMGGYMMMPGAGFGGFPAGGQGMPFAGGPGFGMPQMPQNPRGQGTFAMYPTMPQQGPGMLGPGRYQGRIKSFNAKQGFGFIECHESATIYGRDVFLHKAQIGDLKVGTEVTFSVEMNKQGNPQAREILTMDGLTPGPSPQNVAKGGGASGGQRNKSGGAAGGASAKAGPGGKKKGGGNNASDSAAAPQAAAPAPAAPAAPLPPMEPEPEAR